MDAPGDASISSNGTEHAVRCCRLSGLIKCGGSVAAGPVWKYADRVQIGYASLKALRSDAGFPDPVSSMDAPGDASISSNGTEHAVRCCRLSGLIKCGGSVAAGPVWKYADRVQIGYASLKALRSDAGFPDPVSLTFALTCPPTCPHPRRLPALRRSLRWWREPGSSPSSSSAPRRCAPSCWPAPPRRASSACAPASRPARGPSSRRAEPPSGRQSSRP